MSAAVMAESDGHRLSCIIQSIVTAMRSVELQRHYDAVIMAEMHMANANTLGSHLVPLECRVMCAEGASRGSSFCSSSTLATALRMSLRSISMPSTQRCWRCWKLGLRQPGDGLSARSRGIYRILARIQLSNNIQHCC